MVADALFVGSATLVAVAVMVKPPSTVAGGMYQTPFGAGAYRVLKYPIGRPRRTQTPCRFTSFSR